MINKNYSFFNSEGCCKIEKEKNKTNSKDKKEKDGNCGDCCK